MTTPAWLHERVNDSFGTPLTHEFWRTVNFMRVGIFLIFERDGWFYAYDRRYNSWAHFATASDAVAHAEAHPKGLDIWT
jgi:hypothetical protein